MSRSPRQQLALATDRNDGRFDVAAILFARQKAGRRIARLHDEIDFALPQVARIANQLGIARDEIIVGEAFQLERAVVELDIRRGDT